MQEENHFIETTSGWSSDFSLVFLEQGFLYNDFFAKSKVLMSDIYTAIKVTAK